MRAGKQYWCDIESLQRGREETFCKLREVLRSVFGLLRDAALMHSDAGHCSSPLKYGDGMGA
jgi:hypothetical protein